MYIYIELNVVWFDYTLSRKIYLIGFGSEVFRGASTRMLREVNMKVWENDKCQDVFDGLREIFGTMICAGGKSGKDTCQVLSDLQLSYGFAL